MPVGIRRAKPTDALALARVAERTFREAYAAVTPPEDLERHVAASFTEARQRAELEDAAVRAFLAEHEGVVVGYAQVRTAPPPPCVRGRLPIQLWRCYVAAAWQGQGVAQALMDEALREAARRGADQVWLSVWESNARARAFYRKAGFRDAGEAIFEVGSDRQRDRVMVRSMGPGAAEPHLRPR